MHLRKDMLDGIETLNRQALKIKLTATTENTALLVIDVQKEFASPWSRRGSFATRRIALRIREAAERFRQTGIVVYPIYFSRQADIKSAGPYKFHPRPADRLFFKCQNDAFAHQPLSKDLKACGIENLLICGFNTNACVRETAMSAADSGYNTIVLKDLCGNDRVNRSFTQEETLRYLDKKGIPTETSGAILPLFRSSPGKGYR